MFFAGHRIRNGLNRDQVSSSSHLARASIVVIRLAAAKEFAGNALDRIGFIVEEPVGNNLEHVFGDVVELVELGLTFERRQPAVVSFPSELKLHFVFLERIG